MNFKIEIGHQKKDGTSRVYVSVTSDGKRKRIPTNVYVSKKEYAKSKSGMVIKNIEKQIALEELITNIKKTLLNSSYIIKKISVNDASDVVRESQMFGDFFAFADEWLEMCTSKGKKNYHTAINNFKAFAPNPLPFDQITYSLLKKYEISLQDKPRAQSMYLAAIRHIWREAEKEFERMPRSPFIRYTPPKQRLRAKVERSTDLKTLQAIFNADCAPGTRAEQARDCFMLSFLFMGMNAADLYDCTDLEDGVLKYDRVKVRDRREDNAHIEVNVPERALPLIEKYKGTCKVFNFSKRYKKEDDFQRALNIGLKDLLGADTNITFYTARHTWATIARNECGIDKYTINDALNHVDPEMRVTDIYIKKDYRMINEANSKVINYVFA